MELAGMLLFSWLAQAQSREAAIDEVSADLDKLMAAEHLQIDTAEKLKSSYGSPEADNLTADYCRNFLAVGNAAGDYTLAIGRAEKFLHKHETLPWDTTTLGIRSQENSELWKQETHLDEELKAMGVNCPLILAQLAQPAPQAPKAPEDTTMPPALLWMIGIAAVVVGAIIYFAPSMIGDRKANRWAIFVLNLLLGWTVLGWIGALVWALCAEPSEKPVLSHTTNPVMSHKAFCGHCGNPVATAFCGNCGGRTVL